MLDAQIQHLDDLKSIVMDKELHFYHPLYFELLECTIAISGQ